MRPIATVMLALAVFAFAGCGGGGGGLGTGSPHESARAGTGSQPPQETLAEMSARAAGIDLRADSLVMSNYYGETTDRDRPAFIFVSSCRGTACTITDPVTGARRRVSLSDAVPAFSSTGTGKAVLTKHGITTAYGSINIADFFNTVGNVYVALMNDAAFSVTNARATVDGTTVWTRFSTTTGDMTGSRPGGSATWTGLMTGVPADRAGRDNFLQGDASLIYDFAASSLDASFTGIRNITTNRPHTVTGVRFDDIPVSPDGTFGIGRGSNRIQGGFYGLGHAETAGVFEQRGIVGAFGAKRQ